MSWLRMDDGMGSHRKTRRLLRGQRSGAGLAAFGLHVLGMLHASQYLTDGFVEREFVEETLDDARVNGKLRAQLVRSLVDNGQWEPVEGGWQIHDYLDHNPSRADVEAKRARDAERKARGRHAQSKRSPQGVRADSARTDAGLRAESDGPVPSHTLNPPNPPEGGDAGKVVSFDRRPVPEQRLQLAERLLAFFNDRAGTSYGAYTGRGKPSENLRRIIGALTDHPNVSEEQWQAAVRWRLSEPFWSGKPETGVVFGPKVVDGNLASSMASSSGGASLMRKLVGE